MEREARKRFAGFRRGMGLGGWLTNYKRLGLIPDKWRMVLTPGDEEHFDEYITAFDVKNIRGFGMDHIRLGFDQLAVEDFETGAYRERTLRHIDEFVDWCEDAGLNVLLNLHKAFGAYCDVRTTQDLLADPALCDRFVRLWEMLEERYHARAHVAFEPLNEVKASESDAWNDLAARTIRAIRKSNPSRRIVIGSASWNSPDRLCGLRLYDDENVMYTFHFYAPFAFTHQRGVLQSGPHFYNRVMHYPSPAEPYRDYARLVGEDPGEYAEPTMDRAYLFRKLAGAAEFVRAHPDKVLYLGEFGVIRHCQPQDRLAWLRDVIAFAKAYDLPYCVWNYLSTPYDGNRFSLTDDDARAILSPELLAVIQGGGIS